MDDKRTLVLLGGSAQQIIAIETAKRCGYRTVLCDYLPDNPGQFHADAFYLVSTTDKDAVLEVARAEGAQGIVAYASDPAAPTAAYVAETLGLPTNPFSSVQILSTKTLFREHMRKIGLPCPSSVSISCDMSAKAIKDAVSRLRFPIVVKPTDSSGSKGVTVLFDDTGLHEALMSARSFSRNGILIAEEYIERSYPYVIGGDIFVYDGIVRFWGLIDDGRREEAPLVPAFDALPSALPHEQMASIKVAFQTLVTSLGIRFGGLNVEALVGKDEAPYILELGARAGGNMIPVLLSDVSGIDLVRASVMCAMGDDPGALDWEPRDERYMLYVLNSLKAGEYHGYSLSPMAATACYRATMYQEPNTRVEPFTNASHALGILFFHFDSSADLVEMTNHFDRHIVVDVS